MLAPFKGPGQQVDSYARSGAGSESQFVCAQIYIYIYTYIYTHTHIDTYIHVYIYTYMYTSYIYICICPYIYVYTYTCIHVHVDIHFYTERARERPHTCVYTHMCIYLSADVRAPHSRTLPKQDTKEPRLQTIKPRSIQSSQEQRQIFLLGPKDMGGCQNYGPFLGPYHGMAPSI